MTGAAGMGILDALACGRTPDQRRKAPFLMLQAYFDDSGSEGKGHTFVVAGYVATHEAWQSFWSQWYACLNQEPKLSYFKMKEAFRLRDQFDGWSKAQRDERVSELAEIIGGHVGFGVRSVVWWEDFREFQKWIEPNASEAYTLLFISSITTTIDHLLSKGCGEKLEVVFDHQNSFGARAASLFYKTYLSMSPKYRDRLAGQPVHRDEKYILPLQAADMIAWHARRGANKDSIKMDSLPVPLRDIETATHVYSRGKLARVAQQARDLWEEFPDIDRVFSEDELQAVRKAFLGEE